MRRITLLILLRSGGEDQGRDNVKEDTYRNRVGHDIKAPLLAVKGFDDGEGHEGKVYEHQVNDGDAGHVVIFAKDLIHKKPEKKHDPYRTEADEDQDAHLADVGEVRGHHGFQNDTGKAEVVKEVTERLTELFIDDIDFTGEETHAHKKCHLDR